MTHVRGAFSSGMSFEDFRIGDRIDSERRYHLEFDAAFPLSVKAYEFPLGEALVPMTWHERLELFCPLSGSGSFRMGETVCDFRGGDILVVDHLCLHGVERYAGARRRAVVITFLPELVAGPAALPCDWRLLRIFRQRASQGALLWRRRRGEGGAVRSALRDLVQTQAALDDAVARTQLQSRIKVHLLRLLVLLDEALEPQIDLAQGYEERRERLRRLRPLLDTVQARLAERTSVAAAARMLGMSQSYFMRYFRHATGATFNSWVTQVRLVEAHRMLIETGLAVSEIALATGFCDQSYFDRRFRARFGKTPSEARDGGRRGVAA